MSRSPRRANAGPLLCCAGLFQKRRSSAALQNAGAKDASTSDRPATAGKCGPDPSGLLFSVPHVTVTLRAAFKNEPIQQQQNHGADDRHDPASGIIPPRKDATDPSPYQCAGNTEQNRDDATTGISSRHQ